MRAYVTILFLLSACEPAKSGCDATNCAGCCQADTCVTDQSDAVCGSGGTVCMAESDSAFCARHAAACGTVTATDNCGSARTTNCGTCGSTQTCTNGQCVCVAESDAELCANQGRACGSLTTTDRCGKSRTVA